MDLQDRIYILDGATGTALQQFRLTETDFRGEEFAQHPIPLKGNNDVLNITRPDVIRQVHQNYIDAGADIIETNTFNANAISQTEYGCSAWVERFNLEGARLAKETASACKERKIYVAGSIGPTDKSLTLAPDPDQPTYRIVDFDTLANAYASQVTALIEGGVDLLLVETIYDGLNAKAALYAIAKVQEEKGTHLPVMLSATVNDKSGRTLTGQSLEALFTSLSHYPILSFGLNCSFGAKELHHFLRELAPRIPCYISIYPNAGLPNEMGEYDESPEFTALCLQDMAKEGLINIAGGCCGTTPEHIRAIANALKDIPPRKVPTSNHQLKVSGLDTVVVDKELNNFINIGEGYLARGLHRAVIGQLHQRFRGHVFPKPAVHTGLFPGGQRPLRQPEQPPDAALIVLLLGQPLDMALCLFIGIYAILQPTCHHLFQIAQLLFALFPAVGSCHQQVFGAQLQRTE